MTGTKHDDGKDCFAEMKRRASLPPRQAYMELIATTPLAMVPSARKTEVYVYVGAVASKLGEKRIYRPIKPSFVLAPHDLSQK